MPLKRTWTQADVFSPAPPPRRPPPPQRVCIITPPLNSPTPPRKPLNPLLSKPRTRPQSKNLNVLRLMDGSAKPHLTVSRKHTYRPVAGGRIKLVGNVASPPPPRS